MGLRDRFGKKRTPEPAQAPGQVPDSPVPPSVQGVSIGGVSASFMQQALAQARAQGTLTPQMERMLQKRFGDLGQSTQLTSGSAQEMLTPLTEQVLEQRIAFLRRAQDQGRAQGTLTPQIDQILNERIAALDHTRQLIQGRAQGTLTPEEEQRLNRQVAAYQQTWHLVFPGFTDPAVVSETGPIAPDPAQAPPPTPMPPDSPGPSPHESSAEASWTGSPFTPPGPAPSSGTPFASPGTTPSSFSPFAPPSGFPGTSETPGATDPASRLRQLETLRREGLIGDLEYQAQRQRILEGI